MKKNRVGRWVGISVFVVVALLWSGEAFAAAAKTKVSLKVKVDIERDKSKNSDTQDSGSTSVDTRTETKTETVTLHVTLLNKEEDHLTGTLQWFFISEYSSGRYNSETRDYNTKSVPVVFSPGEREIKLFVGMKQEETIDSETFKFVITDNDSSYSGDYYGFSSSSTKEQGDEYEGYVVVVIVDGNIIASKASSSRYLKEEWMNKWRQAVAKDAESSSE
jgi:hypothetical protein